MSRVEWLFRCRCGASWFATTPGPCGCPVCGLLVDAVGSPDARWGWR